eukprot:m.224544 g.224544  ORF g.224544 m.224544 type:complete len:246 (+) comp16490_c0_seq1:243-980(+)
MAATEALHDLLGGLASPESIESDSEMGFLAVPHDALFLAGALFALESDGEEETEIDQLRTSSCSDSASASFCGSRDAFWNPDSPGEVVLSPASIAPTPPTPKHDHFEYRSLFSSSQGLEVDHFANLEAHGSNLELRVPTMSSSLNGANTPLGGGGMRTAHNAMERERRVNLRKCFDSLRATLPKLRDAKAPSLQILTEASQYILALREEETRLELMKSQLLQRNAALRAALLNGVAPACDPSPIH